MSEQANKLDTVLTADGTITLRDAETGELYHNSGGAFLEAMENYVLPARLQDFTQRHTPESPNVIRMLDACFGLGYNTFSFWHYILNTQHLPVDQVDVVGVELDPDMLKVLPSVLEQDCLKALAEQLKDQSGSSIVDNLRAFVKLGLPTKSLAFSYKADDGPVFNLNLNFGDLRQVVPSLVQSGNANSFDYVFHDPFSPAKVPQLWTFELFSNYFKLLRQDSGTVLTYSAASAVRGGLEQAGFSIYRTRGVGAKKGGTLATRAQISPVDDDLIFALRSEEAARLKTSSGLPYRDPSLSATRKEILHSRDEEQKKFKAKN